MTVEQSQRPDDHDRPPPVLREFLYADLERSRSLLAQRLGGVPEEDRRTDTSLKHLAVGTRHVFGLGGQNQNEFYEQRSLLDAIFPELEQLLEAEGWLTDISATLHDSSITDSSVLLNEVAPGSLVRITAEGSLFDVAYLAHAFAGTAAAASGFAMLAAQGQGPSPSPRDKSRNKTRPNSATNRHPGPGPAGPLEDSIEPYPSEFMGGLDGDVLRAMVKVSRGMFSDGLHLLLNAEVVSTGP